MLATFNYLRRDKLNSQFIVTKFSILHAGDHYSDFKLAERLGWLCSSSRSPEPRPLIRALEWVRPKDCIFTVLDLKSEIFLTKSENHAGGDDNCEFSLPRLTVFSRNKF